MANFRKVGERMLPHEVLHVKINPSMDIAALALSTADIAINRLYTWQRVWSITKPKFVQQTDDSPLAIVDMVWSPDGKILAVAYNKPVQTEEQQKHSDECHSSIVLYLIETNQRSMVFNLPHHITCLCWRAKSHYDNGNEPGRARPINIDNMKMPLDTLTTPYVDLFVCDEELLDYPFGSLSSSVSGNSDGKGSTPGTPKPDGNNKPGSATGKKFGSTLPSVTKFCQKDDQFFAYDKLNLRQNQTVNVLVVGTKDNRVLFYLWGFYRILDIDVGRFLPTRRGGLEKIWMANDLNTVQVLVEEAGFFQLETLILSRLWKEIYLVQRIRLNIDIRLAFLRDTIKEICSIWSDMVIDIDSCLSNYEIEPDQESGQTADRDGEDHSKTTLKPKDFIDMLVFGTIGMNLERFLHDLSRKNAKLFHSFENSINEIYRLIITRLMNTLVHMLSYVDNLRGMVLNDLQFGQLGLSIEVVNIFRREIVMMMDKCNRLMLTLNDLKPKILAFTHFISKGVHMVQCSTPGGTGEFGTESKLSNQDQDRMTHKDFHLVMDFLGECSRFNGFKFDWVGRLLKNSERDKTGCMDKNGQDNPYKAYMHDKQMKRFLEIVVSGKLKKSSDMSDQELLKLFFGPLLTDLLPDTIKEKELQDPDGTSQWFQMLSDDHWNLDTINEELFASWSLTDHLERLQQMQNEVFLNSHHHMTDQQARLIEESKKNILIKLAAADPIDRNHLFDSSSESNSAYFCFGHICPEHDAETETSTLSLARFKKTSNRDDGQMELVRFCLTSGKCFDDCHCPDGVRFQVEDFQFYNSDLMTMIVTEQHNSPSNGSRKQYLLQCQYSKIFETVPVSQMAFQELPDRRRTTAVTQIDLRLNLERIHEAQNTEDSMVVDQDPDTSTGSLFKIRLLEMVNQQRCLSVSGNRNLACCSDLARCRVTTFEMDACEDEDAGEETGEGDGQEDPVETPGTIWT